MPQRSLQLVKYGHGHEQDYEVGQGIETGRDRGTDIGVDAMMPDTDRPVRTNWQALKDGSEGLHETVAGDEDADYPQHDCELSGHEENAIVQVQYRELCWRDRESPDDFCG